MRRRGPTCYYAFDLLWLDGKDLRERPLLERKACLRKLLPRHPHSVLYVDHVTAGTELFRVVCERDMEGIVAKLGSAPYAPDETTWVKIKNQHYSQAVGRHDFFDRRRARAYVGASIRGTDLNKSAELNPDENMTSGMYDFTREEIDLEKIRARLRKMTDDQLVRYGKSAAFMAKRDDRETWRVQLNEARAEWKRRHPSTSRSV
jgi:ATP-dependent DNA ligase